MADTTPRRATFVLFGDSITELSFAADGGWGTRLAEHYARRADVLNRGLSGYNTRWALSVLPWVFGGVPQPELVTVFFGANDASSPELNLRQHVPLEEFEANLVAIVRQLRGRWGEGGGPRIVLIAPPPVGHEQRLAFQIERYKEKATGKLERTNELAGMYAAAVARAAHTCAVPLLDTWGTMQAEKPDGSWTEYLSDGLHLSPAGQRFVGEELVKLVLMEHTTVIT